MGRVRNIIFISSLISLFFKPKCLHVDTIMSKSWIDRIGTYRTFCFMKYTSVLPCKFVLPSELFYCCLYFTEASSIYKSFEFCFFFCCRDAVQSLKYAFFLRIKDIPRYCLLDFICLKYPLLSFSHVNFDWMFKGAHLSLHMSNLKGHGQDFGPTLFFPF